MCGFRCVVQQKGLPSQWPRPPRPATPEPRLVTRNCSAADLDINVHLLASRPDSLPFLCSEQKIIFRKVHFCKVNFSPGQILKRFFSRFCPVWSGGASCRTLTCTAVTARIPTHFDTICQCLKLTSPRLPLRLPLTPAPAPWPVLPRLHSGFPGSGNCCLPCAT